GPPTLGAKMTAQDVVSPGRRKTLPSPESEQCSPSGALHRAPIVLFLCLTLLLPGVVGACAQMGGGSPGPESGLSTLRVVNRGWQDATIYSVRGTTRIRMGMVSGLSNREFAIPTDALEGGHTLVLFADPVGGFEGYRSPATTVSQGDRVELWLQPILAQSSVLVR
ncbi:MAG: hypothetical protein WEA09_02710, partial [Gemmatimonadota bacterium]